MAQKARPVKSNAAGTSHQIHLRGPVTRSTAAVQVGARSTAGIASAANAGKNAQWNPSSLMRTAATTRSSTSLAGEAKPSPKSGKSMSCRASAAAATTRAALTRVAGVCSLEGAVEVGGSVDHLLWQWLCHRGGG